MKNNARKVYNPSKESKFSELAEARFKLILQILSWIVGVSFSLIIILPNFEFSNVDLIVKIVFFVGFGTLLLFAVLEFFGDLIKSKLDGR